MHSLVHVPFWIVSVNCLCINFFFQAKIVFFLSLEYFKLILQITNIIHVCKIVLDTSEYIHLNWKDRLLCTNSEQLYNNLCIILIMPSILLLLKLIQQILINNEFLFNFSIILKSWSGFKNSFQSPDNSGS